MLSLLLGNTGFKWLDVFCTLASSSLIAEVSYGFPLFSSLFSQLLRNRSRDQARVVKMAFRVPMFLLSILQILTFLQYTDAKIVTGLELTEKVSSNFISIRRN